MQLDGEGGVGMLRIEFVSPDAKHQPIPGCYAAIDATAIELLFVQAKRRPQTPAEASRARNPRSRPRSEIGEASTLLGIGATSENGSVVELEPDRSDHCRKRGMSEREATAKDRSCSVRCSSVKRGLDILAATSEKSLSRVQAFIKLADRTERPLVPEIAAALGVSDRTIRNDFEQLFGVGPARFLRLRRMQAVRWALLAREGNVTRIAVEHGFTQLGRFSGEYRALFGELPSQTAKDAAWASMMGWRRR